MDETTTPAPAPADEAQDEGAAPDLVEETVELTPDEPALHVQPIVDPLHERDIPHTDDLQEPDGDNSMPGDTFVVQGNNRIN